MKLIKEAKDQTAVIKIASGRYRGFIESECRQRWQAHSVWEVSDSAPPLYAEIEHANWAVVCDTCREAVVIDYGEIHFCPNCLNLAHGNKARRVVFPEPEKRKAIETLLSRRPNPDNRNWLPHESIQDLQNENVTHGLSAVLE